MSDAEAKGDAGANGDDSGDDSMERDAAVDSFGQTAAQLTSSPDQVRAAVTERVQLQPGELIPGTRLRIVRWLGSGAMGEVFAVHHLDIERSFAAKLLHDSDSVARARRFRREARATSKVGSPWVVDIFDFKELPDGRLMYLMELVDGTSLHRYRRTHGAMELSELLALARQLCKGLADAHAAGLVHRDIKAENIMLAKDASNRLHAKIVDFGLAALLGDEQDGRGAGTPAYMAPEQVLGKVVDPRADLYSLGATLYELACGHRPFVREDEQALMRAHLEDQPVPPSSHLGGDRKSVV